MFPFVFYETFKTFQSNSILIFQYAFVRLHAELSSLYIVMNKQILLKYLHLSVTIVNES